MKTLHCATLNITLIPLDMLKILHCVPIRGVVINVKQTWAFCVIWINLMSVTIICFYIFMEIKKLYEKN